MQSRPVIPVVLLALLAIAAALRIGLALLSPNLFWPDEIYQTIEPAHRMVFGNGIESFEWLIGLRSYVIPVILSGVVWLTEPLAQGSAGYLSSIVALLSLLSLWSVVAAMRIGQLAAGGSAALFALLLGSCWFDLVYFAPKALTEVFAAHLLVPAIAIGLAAQTDQRKPIAVASALLGLAVAIRPHIGPGAGIAWLWFVLAAPRQRWLIASIASAAPILLFGIADWITHGRPFGSLLVNLGFNVAEGGSLEFGWLPKHYYAVYLWRTWTPPVAVIFGLLWLLSLRRAPLPAVAALAIIGAHSLLGHKEYRFIFPAIPLLLIGVAVGAASAVQRLRAVQRPFATWIAITLFTAASIYAGTDFHRQKTPTGLGDQREATSYWTAFGDPLAAMRDLSQRDDVQGLAITGIEWQFCGGYSWLHHDVPIFFVDHPRTPTPAWPHVNYLMTQGGQAPDGFAEVARYGGVALLRRDGDVVVLDGYDLGAVLQGR